MVHANHGGVDRTSNAIKGTQAANRTSAVGETETDSE
jgi:hypothetical protein